jgi:hypothetical protein
MLLSPLCYKGYHMKELCMSFRSNQVLCLPMSSLGTSAL